jgi:hypothetical protein
MIRWWLGWLGEVLPIECEKGLSVIEMEKVLFDSVFLGVPMRLRLAVSGNNR